MIRTLPKPAKAALLALRIAFSVLAATSALAYETIPHGPAKALQSAVCNHAQNGR